jgi:16S rRNA (adenine1518-N6/adenine1519-N6)-dimethyltransferase
MGRKFGQHFLANPRILDQLMGQAAVQPGERVLEVGPGKGVLTERLLAAGAQVTAVEIDPELVPGLQQRWDEHPSFRLIPADILKTALDPQALFDNPGRYAVIANLPYYLTTPLLFRFIRERERFTRLLIMVQKEVADRMAAAPSDGHAYGSLSIATQIAFTAETVLRVPASAFHPQPKVASAIVRLLPRPPRLPKALEEGFLEYIKGLFSQRRKVLAGTLRRTQPPWPPAALNAALELVGNRRPEALSPEEHMRVYTVLRGGSEPASN